MPALDVTAFTDDELEQARRDIETEQAARRTRAEMLAREAELAAQSMAELNRQPGAPWVQPTALTPYALGDEVTIDGKRWASLLDGNVWQPGVSGWREVTADGSPPPWLQPSGAHDAYRTGAMVTFGGAIYRSLIDANVWPPDVYPTGWLLVPAEDADPGNDIPPDVDPIDPEPEPEPEREPEPSPAAWAVGVAYAVGDQVTFNGTTYTCRQAHTSLDGWTPAAVLSLWLPA